MIKINNKFKLVRNIALASVGLMSLASCDAFKDDLPTCPKAQMQMTFTWNMDFIDRFQDDVHCIDVYIFNVVGTKVGENYETKFFTYAELNEDQIKAGNNSVDLNAHLKPGETLAEGKYIAVIYGGNNCSLTSFDKTFTVDENLTLHDLSLHLNESKYDNPNLTEAERGELELHDSFFGIQEFEVKANQLTNTVVDLKRNTNKIHVNMYYKDQVTAFNDINDYSLEIVDDNNDLLFNNRVDETGEVTYRPFEKSLVNSNKNHNSTFSLSRLVIDGNENLPELRIANNNPKTKADGEPQYIQLTEDGSPWKLIDHIKQSDRYKDFLNNYKSNIDNDQNLQEYLDRNYDWYIDIALGEYNGFITASVTVRPWDVRNDEFEAQ